jgi:CubicO group peptidase (beta-lactamase class C family)
MRKLQFLGRWPSLTLSTVALAFVIATVHSEPPASTTKIHVELDAYLSKQFPVNGPGAAVLVIHRGHPILDKGFGLADVEKKVPISPTTNFDLASCSKQFTALAVMLLADRGKLSFDDDIRKHLPELPVFDQKHPIRIRDLLHHTSGLPDYTSFWKSKYDDFTKLTCEGVVELLKDRKLDFSPGAKFDYSNTNYAFLPVIVSRVSGKRFGDFMREEVFQPLGMNRTVVFDDMSTVVLERATGYRKRGSKWEKSSLDGPTCGDGNVFTNLQDLARWDAAITAGKLANAETWKLAFTPGRTSDGKATKYGFGWNIGERQGKPMHNHGGGWAGTRTAITRFPVNQFTIVVLSNNEATSPGRVSNRIADIVLASE